MLGGRLATLPTTYPDLTEGAVCLVGQQLRGYGVTTRQLRRSGGSLAVTIPAALRRGLQLSEGDVVEIRTKRDGLCIALSASLP